MKLFVTLALFLTIPLVQAADALKAFPPPDPGMLRYVIKLPKQANEAALQVELLIGKTVTTDAANRYFFGGTVERESIPGWGYDRYVLRELGPMAGTLMAVPPDAKKVDRFVTLGGEPRLLRYNSRLPLVVYVPEGVEVRYRFWRADPTLRKAVAGCIRRCCRIFRHGVTSTAV